MKLLLLILGFIASFSVVAAEVNVQENIPSSNPDSNQVVRPLPADKAMTESHLTHYDFWFHDVWVNTTLDRDYDGYASAFTLQMDADTVFNGADVYAVVYLGTDNHYSSLYVTSDFSLYGNSSSDELTLDIDLLTGYPAKDYNILIELYDAYTSELLTFTNYTSDPDLAFQPLESRNYDVEYVEQAVIVEHYGGSVNITLLTLMSVLAVCARLKRRSAKLGKRQP